MVRRKLDILSLKTAYNIEKCIPYKNKNKNKNKIKKSNNNRTNKFTRQMHAW